MPIGTYFKVGAPPIFLEGVRRPLRIWWIALTPFRKVSERPLPLSAPGVT